MEPFASTLKFPEGILMPHRNHLVRRLSSMRGQYYDAAAFEARVAAGDPVIYEVYENSVPETSGELQHGTSIVHPGRVGDEYIMTKGHFHAVLETAEVYYCLRGHGYLLMETPEGEWNAQEMAPGVLLYVPPRWAHRSINTGSEDLITLFVYPGNGGHDYRTIETRGFRRIVVERGGAPAIVDNPRWTRA
jgi:glucose-6-phosphate isomerase, archaeal